MQRYNPKEIEPKWQQQWAESKIYEASTDQTKPKRYVLEYFPYPSGAAMHVGHVRNYTIGDVVSRHARMQGYNVLHPMGWDAFGLPAENYAIKTGISPQQAIAENTGKFKQQLMTMGFSYDWSREFASSDPDYYRWTQWFFLLLHKRGLAYRQESLQWWCPVDKTVLANEQVEAGRCWRCGSEVEKKALKQWFFKITDYADRLAKDLDDVDWSESIKSMQRNWIGRSTGAEITFAVNDSAEKITVFTTRADTLFGATFLVVAPEHPILSKIVPETHRQQVENYQQKARNKSDIERQETNREKTGVFTGAYAVNPTNGEKLPIWTADYVLMGYGTGAIMAVPGHDERDAAFAEKFELPIVRVIKNDEPDEAYTHEPGTLTNSGAYDGLQTDEARLKIVTDLAAQGAGREKVNYRMRDWLISRQRYWGAPIPMIHCSSCKERIEQHAYSINFYQQSVWDQIISGAKTIESRADNPEEPERRFADIKAGEYLKFVNKQNAEVRWAKVQDVKYFKNLAELYKDTETMRAICGGTVPGSLEALEKMYADLADGYAEKIAQNGLVTWQFELVAPGIIPVPEGQLPVVLPELKSFEPSGDGRSPLANVPEFVNTTCPQCGGPAERETDTMDGFACSSWYFLRFADPHNAEKPFDADKVKFWLPVDDYIGGAEHAVMHLLYARMWTKVMQDEGLIEFGEPFKALRNQGMILAPDGQKMSKSKGNTIQPDELIGQGYGADSIRIMEMFIGPWNQSANWSVEGMGGSFRFLQRIWNLVQEHVDAVDKSDVANEAMRRTVHRTVKKVSDDLADMGFNTAIAALMELTNDLYKLKAEVPMGATAWKDALMTTVQLLAPFAPHITEELWQQLGNGGSVHVSQWPAYDERYLVEDTVTIAVQVNGKLRGTITAPAGSDQAAAVELAHADVKIAANLAGGQVVKTIYVANKLLNFVVK